VDGVCDYSRKLAVPTPRWRRMPAACLIAKRSSICFDVSCRKGSSAVAPLGHSLDDLLVPLPPYLGRRPEVKESPEIVEWSKGRT